MDERTPRYDAATIEQAVLTVLFEMRALINVFEDKGLLRVGEVSEEIQRMKNLAAGFASAGARRDRGDSAGARPKRVSGTGGGNGDS